MNDVRTGWNLQRWAPATALALSLAFVWADTPGAQPLGRVIYMATIEPRGGAQQDKEPFPATPLPAGEGYRKTPPDANGRWEVVTYQWSPGTIVVREGEPVTLEIVGINGDVHPSTIPGIVDSFTVRRGQVTHVTFTATKPGVYSIICTKHTPNMPGHPRRAAQVGQRRPMNVTRRGMFKTALATLVASARWPRPLAAAAVEELKMPNDVPMETLDFEAKGVEGWTVVDGQWAIEEMTGVPSGKKVLVQRATRNQFNVIVAPPGPYTDVDASVKFKPISGREDASGGLVFRFADGKYYVVRANALEDNFRLYYYDRGRRQIATARVKAPALGQWHTVRLVAVGDHLQAWLDGTLLLDHRDSRFKSGRVGLWTKADSITAFDDLTIRGVSAGA